ncbi:uncharacterized protein CLUP02_00170 [Colletotrichum lupini]|uniref:Extracellular membrane protein CFEM domain-containing protein n=1 Tax=Colletotrichum lupini TaxID=145971 RepID=A0A9Q8SAH7_9PEZI|nr:uncharacterized protein CLUP02_00170 [Colletotrichum lupini]KAK1719024.1 hypothetical protein BDP67DRAFT_574492 [Colletotrichum lupini]UQC73525.1 hypothetical protein CLUP02_00170 [Colletotrichum lupini]
MRASFEQNAYRYLICSLLLLLSGFRQAHATYYLNQADGYDSLPSCAEPPISSIVRDMVAGCGDGGKTTSYSCFCTASSDRFREIIATSVAKNCGRSGVEVESATSVFDAYCQMEKTDKVTTSATEVTSTSATATSAVDTASASLVGSGGLTSVASPTSSSSPATSNSTNSGISTGAIVAVSACTSLVAVALCAAAFFLWRRRQKRLRPGRDAHGPVYEVNHPGELDGSQEASHGAGEYYAKPELEARSAVREMHIEPKARRHQLAELQ